MNSDADGARIRESNDRLRTTQASGQILLTEDIYALGPLTVATILKKVTELDIFCMDNDPCWGIDWGTLKVSVYKFQWKIDYYDNDHRQCAPDQSDPLVSLRIMTIMLAEEY